MIDHPKGNTSIQNGEDVTLTVSAVGPQHLTYRWMKDGQELHSAEDADKITIPSFSTEEEGYYSCIISTRLQSYESKPALLRLGTQQLTVHIIRHRLADLSTCSVKCHTVWMCCCSNLTDPVIF